MKNKNLILGMSSKRISDFELNKITGGGTAGSTGVLLITTKKGAKGSGL